MIPIDKIRPNPDQPRKHFDEAALTELAESIDELGMLQPIAVRVDGEGYLIVAGERRWRAAQQAGLVEIPAVVLQVSDDEAFIAAIAENVNREDMSPIEEARAFAVLLESRDKDEVAKLFGKSRTYIETRVFLLRLDEELQHFVARGQISMAVGWHLARLSPAAQFEAVRAFDRAETDPEKIRVISALVERESEITMFAIDDSEVKAARVRDHSGRQVSNAEKAAVALDRLLDIAVTDSGLPARRGARGPRHQDEGPPRSCPDRGQPHRQGPDSQARGHLKLPRSGLATCNNSRQGQRRGD